MKKKLFAIPLFLICFNIFSHTGIMSGEKNIKINKTKYFDIIYSENSVQTAKILYDKADSIYEELAEKFSLKNKFRLPVVISAAQDDFNAYFSCGPFNHIVIFDTVCTTNLAVFSEETLNTFRHELTHAITYNLKNDFWFNFDKILGDVYNPVLLTITQAWAEGATVSIESDKNEGRLNSEYALQILKQAKIEGKFPKYSEIQGAMDVFPAGNASYMFGGAFCGWLQQKFGMEKYAEFWYRSVNLKSLTYFSCFKKVYGISIKDAWKEFYNELEVPEIPANPTENPFIKNVPFKNQLSAYPTLTSNGKDFFYYDKYKKTVNQADSEKSKVLHKDSDISRLNVSKDGRFLVESYSSSFYAVPKNKIRIYDTQKKSFFYMTEKSLRDAAIIFADEKYFLCAVKTSSAFSTLKIYELQFKKNKICGTELVFQKEFPIEQQIFSLEGNSSGKLFYILKDKLEFSINEFDLQTKSEKIFKATQKGIVFQGLNYFENEKNQLLAFSFTRKGELPRLGLLSLNETPTFKLLSQNISGGFFNPVIFSEKKAIFAANFYKGSKFFSAELSNLEFKEFPAQTESAEISVSAQEQKATNSNSTKSEDFTEFSASSKKFSAFKYNFSGPHGTFVPLAITSTFANKNLSTLDSLWLPFGMTYVSSTPWTNPIWYVSAGYNLLTNSEALRFSVTGNSLTELFAYSGTAQIEFDDKGYKQTFGNLIFNSKLPLFGTSYIKFSESGTILEGRQSETSISKDKNPQNLSDYFKILKPTNDEFLYLSNSAAISFGNIHKSGFNYFDYSGVQIGATLQNNFLSFADNLDINKRFDNISLTLLLKNSTLIPITFEAALFPTEDYIAAAMAKIVLFNWEIQKSTDFLPLFYANRLTLSTYYVGKIEDKIDSWAIKEISTYFEHIKDGKTDYSDELALTCSFSFTPNIGGFARNSFMFTISGNAKYRFFPAENQKNFIISAGIGSNISF